MTPGCRGDVNITELINLAAGVANVRTNLRRGGDGGGRSVSRK